MKKVFKVVLVVLLLSFISSEVYSKPIGIFMIFYRQQIEETDFGIYADHRMYTDSEKFTGQQSFFGLNWNITKFMTVTGAPGIEYYDNEKWNSIFFSTGWFITDKWNLFTEHVKYYNKDYYNYLVTIYKFYKNIGFGGHFYQGSEDMLKAGFQFEFSSKNNPLFFQFGWEYDLKSPENGLMVAIGYAFS